MDQISRITDVDRCIINRWKIDRRAVYQPTPAFADTIEIGRFFFSQGQVASSLVWTASQHLDTWGYVRFNQVAKACFSISSKNRLVTTTTS